jgi:hypothetical protein
LQELFIRKEIIFINKNLRLIAELRLTVGRMLLVFISAGLCLARQDEGFNLEPKIFVF